MNELQKSPAELGDERDASLGKEPIEKSQFITIVRQFSVVQPARALIAIFSQWSIIGAVTAFANHERKWYVFLLAGIVIATRQHAMAILVHDAVHYRLTKRHRLNDLLSNWLLAYPLGISTEMYRRWHFAHHRFVGSPDDPEQKFAGSDPNNWQWPTNRRKLFSIFLKDISGINSLVLVRMVQPWSPPLQVFARDGSIFSARVPQSDAIGFTVFAMCLIVFAWVWPTNALIVVALWLIPMHTVTMAIVHLRSIAEHLVVERTHELNSTRTVLPTWLERAVISPFNVNYHLEHHMFPSVPWYNLHRLHRVLIRDERFRSFAHLTSTYLDLENGLIGEITRRTVVEGAGRDDNSNCIRAT